MYFANSMYKHFILFIFPLLLFASCNSGNEEACAFEPENAAPIYLDFEMLQDSLVNVSSKSGLGKIFNTSSRPPGLYV